MTTTTTTTVPARPVLPPPQSAQELGARRIALTQALRPDGTLGLIGPTVRDLRMGMEILGPTSSGKSYWLRGLISELARVGAGFGLIDRKGDLADEVLDSLPPETHDRVVVIDVLTDSIPCLNPLDRRFGGQGVSTEQLVGQAMGLFARLDPETWPTSLGMQQFARFGLMALVEGTDAPTLLHLDRLFACTRYREQVLQRVRTPKTREFWQHDYPTMDPTLKRSVESLGRRLQQFILAPLVQQVLGQPQSTLDLPTLMDQRAIIIIKLVAEVISEELATMLSMVFLAALVTATFTRQQTQPDSDARWDWPLIIDEIDKCIDTEHVGDAETFFTKTRGLGVGILGAHQGLWQLGPAVGSAAVQALGGLCVLGPIKDDARTIAEAYEASGITTAHLSGLRARHELLIRFPVDGQDTGLMAGVPRRLPPIPPARSAVVQQDFLRQAAHRSARPPQTDAASLQCDAWLARLWRMGDTDGPQVAATTMLDHLTGQASLDRVAHLVAALEHRRHDHQQAQLTMLRLQRDQFPDQRTYLIEQSTIQYGVDPALAAVRAALLTRQYPPDPPPPPRRPRKPAAAPTTRPAARQRDLWLDLGSTTDAEGP